MASARVRAFAAFNLWKRFALEAFSGGRGNARATRMLTVLHDCQPLDIGTCDRLRLRVLKVPHTGCPSMTSDTFKPNPMLAYVGRAWV